MRCAYQPSFERSIKHCIQEERDRIIDFCADFIEKIAADEVVTPGLGLKHLIKDIWEIRIDIRIRIIFRWQAENINFILAGNHDQVKHFLKTV
jgi:hypothetical protein